jgi:hypothetical protein
MTPNADYEGHGGAERRADRPASHPDDCDCFECVNYWLPAPFTQVGWRSRLTGEICDCPVYERSPHADSDPIYVAPPSSNDSYGAGR